MWLLSRTDQPEVEDILVRYAPFVRDSPPHVVENPSTREALQPEMEARPQPSLA